MRSKNHPNPNHANPCPPHLLAQSPNALCHYMSLPICCPASVPRPQFDVPNPLQPLRVCQVDRAVTRLPEAWI